MVITIHTTECTTIFTGTPSVRQQLFQLREQPAHEINVLVEKRCIFTRTANVVLKEILYDVAKLAL